MTLTGKAAEDLADEIRRENEKNRVERIARAKVDAAARGKEPFDLAKLETDSLVPRCVLGELRERTGGTTPGAVGSMLVAGGPLPWLPRAALRFAKLAREVAGILPPATALRSDDGGLSRGSSEDPRGRTTVGPGRVAIRRGGAAVGRGRIVIPRGGTTLG